MSTEVIELKKLTNFAEKFKLMFAKEVYMQRRAALVKKMQEMGQGGIAIFLGNNDAAMNYKDNCFRFRQDSSFSYFWGIDEPGFAASLNLENGKACIYANDIDIDDIIWTGPQPSVADKAELVGVARCASLKDFETAVQFALQNDVPVHFLPQARYWNRLRMAELTGTAAAEVFNAAPYEDGDYVHASQELVKAVIELRLIKDAAEIAEIDKACDMGVIMHSIGRKACKLGALERDIAGAMDAYANCKGWGVSFPTILSQNGQILHGHDHSQIITDGRLLLVDAGLTMDNYYCSDFTRTYPSSGRFTQQQREIYDIVEGANETAFKLAKPGTTYRSVHIDSCKYILSGLKELGILNGDVDEMSAEGIAGMFMPHGLGHNMGLDVHDMEDLGENLVGYDPDQQRAQQLGLGSLRMARKLVPGHVITDEPGIYFIPALWEYFRKNKMDKGFVNFQKLQAYENFGGIRLEDDLLITEDGVRHLGTTRLPIKAADVEETMAKE